MSQTEQTYSRSLAVGQCPRHGTLAYDEQPYATLVCRLMVSTPVIHPITWITTHLPNPKGWEVELAWLADPYRTLFLMSTMEQAYIRESPSAKDLTS